MVANKCADTPKVSVIIPCYNVEDYVESCVNSILEQTLENIEVICVNDGSSDFTVDVLLEIAKKDSRVSVLTQANAGQGAARNEGVKCAKGEYLYFMDSDDLLEKDALEYLYNYSNENTLDVLYFDGTSFYESEELEELKPSYKEYYIRKFDYSECKTGPDLLVEMKKNGEYRQSPCLQFIRHAYFLEKDLWYLQGIWFEDNSFTFKTMIYAERVAHVPKAFFHRRVRENSVMTSDIKFVHTYGIFYNYIDMLHVVQSMEFSQKHEIGAAKILDGVLDQTRKKYRALEDEEKYKYQILDSVERSLFFSFIVHSKLDVVELTNEKKELQKKWKEQKKEIDRLTKSEKKALKKVDALKKEKKALEKEVNKLKNSKRYKLGSFFVKPFDWLRKIFGK